VSGRVLLMAALLGSQAPVQCGSQPDPAMAREERPGEALYGLAQEFEAEGNHEAWADTLRYLIRRHPSSRFAKSARADLQAAGASAADGP